MLSSISSCALSSCVRDVRLAAENVVAQQVAVADERRAKAAGDHALEVDLKAPALLGARGPFGHALRGYRIHVHTSGANPKSWALAAMCAAAGKVARVPPLITFHSGLTPLTSRG